MNTVVLKIKIASILMLISSASFAQFFNNVNSELCYELYKRNDALSEYRVYIVIDKETISDNDIELIKTWDKLSQQQKSNIVTRWTMEGKRVEGERSPYISYPPIFPTKKKAIQLQTVPKNKGNWSLWQ